MALSSKKQLILLHIVAGTRKAAGKTTTSRRTEKKQQLEEQLRETTLQIRRMQRLDEKKRLTGEFLNNLIVVPVSAYNNALQYTFFAVSL